MRSLFTLHAWLRRTERFWDFLLGRSQPLLPLPITLRRPAVEQLEDRVVPSRLPLPILYVGTGLGESPMVRAYDGDTGKLNFEITPYNAWDKGGVRVATGDFDGDQIPDVITAPGIGGGPRIRVFSGASGDQLPAPLGNFFAYEPWFLGGVQLASGDVNGDGTEDIIAAAGIGGGPRVRVFSGVDASVLADFFAYDPHFFGGIQVAADDVDRDGKAEVVVGAGLGGGPHIKLYDLDKGIATVCPGPLGSFFAFDSSQRGGVFVGVGDVNEDAFPDVIAGAGVGQDGRVRAFSGKTGAMIADFVAFDKAPGGVRVASFYLDDGHAADIVAAPGPGAAGKVRVFSGTSGVRIAGPLDDLAPFGADSLGGLWVAAQNDPPPYPGIVYGAARNRMSEGQWDWFRAEVPKSTESGAPSPTGTITFTDALTGEVLDTVTLTTLTGGSGAGDGIADLLTPVGEVGSWGITLAYSGDASYTSGVGSVYVTVDARNPETCVCDMTSASATGAGGNTTALQTGGGVGPDGKLLIPGPGLTGGVGSVSVSQSTAWTNAPYVADKTTGYGMLGGMGLRLVQLDLGPTAYCLVFIDGSSTVFFDKYGSAYGDTNETFHARHKEPYKLVADSKNDVYVLTDGQGRKYTFDGLDPGQYLGSPLISITDPANHATTLTYNGSGQLDEVVQADSTGASTITDSILHTYSGGYTATATLRRKVDAGSYTTIRTAEYGYYSTGNSNGSAGDLRLAVVKDAGGNTIDTSYYRYYNASGSGSGSGSGGHLLKYAFGPAAYARLTNALGTNLDSLTDTQVAPYADHFLTYDSSSRVTTHTAAGAGCSLCTGGQGTYTYTYADATHAAEESSLANTWVRSVAETRPDGTVATYYTNRAGQVMLESIATGGQTWNTFKRYDARGRLILEAGPSVVTGFDTKYADLVNYVSGNASYLSDSAGLVSTTSYASSTTATTSTAGNVAGFVTSTAIQRGETGTSVPQSAMTYLLRPDGGTVVAAETQYRNSDGTGGQTTSFAYTFHSGTSEPQTVTTTLPTVTTAQNGPNSATTSTVAYDTYGRAIWMKDGGGFLTYTAYDAATGSATKTIADVNTSNTSDFANLPSGWSTPSGGGLHLIATAEVDSFGRTTKATDPLGHVSYMTYNDAGHEVRSYPGWDSGTNLPTGPTSVMREDRARSYTESLTMTATPTVSSGRPTGTESISGLQTLSRSFVNAVGQSVYSDAYFNLSGLSYTTSTSLGTLNTHFYRSYQDYTHNGWANRSVTAAGTIKRMVFDGLGRVTSEWVGTDDTPTSGAWSPTNLTGTNTVKVREYEYDGGGVGDGNLTKVTEIPGLSAANRVTQTWFDWRNRSVLMKAGVEGSESTSLNRPISYTEYDNLGQTVTSEMYDGDAVTVTTTSGVPDRPSASLLRAKSTAEYDELGRAFRTKTYSVDPSSGSVSSTALTSNTWFDVRGLAIKSSAPGGLVQKVVYDGLGRATTVYTTDGGADSGFADADDVTSDNVLSQSETTYDANSNVLMTTQRERFHDETGTGALGTASTGVKARVSYSTAYYDLGNRLTDSVTVGTNGGSAYTRPSSVPSRSDTVLVVGYVYDSAGRLWKTTDPRALESRTEYDALGRTTKTIANYVNGTVSDDDDKTTEYMFGPAGMTSLTAKLTGGGGQTTEWVFGVTQSSNGLDSNDIVGVTKWPDPSTGSASSSEQETVTVNALGQTVTTTDRNANVHTLSYDVLGRITADAVTTLGSGVDGTLRRVETVYDTQGNAYLFTNYDAATGGNVVNQVKREFNGLGQLTSEWQEHSGAVTGSSQRVQYAYTVMASGANHSRLTSVTYPNGKVLTYNYASGLNDSISRLSSLSDTSGTLESYDYLGLGTVVRRGHSQPGVDLTYIKQSGESNGDAGDQYTGLDRFYRVVDQRWIKTSDGSHTDRFQYGYDRNGNRTYRDNLVNTAFGEVYTYDGLNQVSTFKRGTLNSGKTDVTGTASRTQSWDFDALGNWDSVTTDGTAQTRTHNKQNEIGTVSGATSPTFDANGNMTTDETSKQFVFDAWNRLKIVKNSGGTTLETLGYDALNRRVSATVSGTTTDFYYSSAWQVLEERVSGAVKMQYVWSPVYVDAMILRDRDTVANGSLDERLWPLQDGNWNVTALVNGSGVVQERYAYDTFGKATVYDASYAVRSGGSSYAWTVLFQGYRQNQVTGNYHARMRDYSPTVGRWATTDPLGFGAGSANLYQYEDNTPPNSLDPSGLLKFVYDKDACELTMVLSVHLFAYKNWVKGRMANGLLKAWYKQRVESVWNQGTFSLKYTCADCETKWCRCVSLRVKIEFVDWGRNADFHVKVSEGTSAGTGHGPRSVGNLIEIWFGDEGAILGNVAAHETGHQIGLGHPGHRLDWWDRQWLSDQGMYDVDQYSLMGRNDNHLRDWYFEKWLENMKSSQDPSNKKCWSIVKGRCSTGILTK